MIAVGVTTATFVTGGATATMWTEPTMMIEGLFLARRGAAARAMERRSQDIVHRVTEESIIAARAQKELDLHVIRVAANHPGREHVPTTDAARATASRLVDRTAEAQPAEQQDGPPSPAT
jgi:hypothetical protein